MCFSFMKRGPQPKRFFNAAQCRARSKLALSIARVVSDPKLRARLRQQATKMEQRAAALDAQPVSSKSAQITT
jgi:hypothetical protein